MRLIYLDEAGTSHPGQEPFLVVAGVVVHGDEQWKLIEDDLTNLVAETIPEPDRDGFVFHALELFNGGRYFTREKWPREIRWEILSRLIGIIIKHRIPIVCGFVDRNRYAGKIDEFLAPERVGDRLKRQIIHGAAYTTCAMRAEKWMQQYAANEVAMFIAEDNPQIRRYIKTLHRLLRDPHQAIFQIDDDRVRPLTKTIDTIHFVEKNETSIMQLADVCAFVLRRRLAGKEDANQFLEPITRNLIWPIDDPEKVYLEMRGA